MVNAVVLAGGRKEEYKDKWNYKRLYGRIIPGEEKALREYKGKPMISHVFWALRNSKNIKNFVIVGNKTKLEEKLSKYGINDVVYLEQDTTLVQNAMIGYNYFRERGERMETLFISSDIPEVSNGIDEFIMNSVGEFRIAVVPKRILEKYEKIFHFPYFWMINKKNRRDGYRWGNMFIANPEYVKNKELINIIFSLRKLLDKENRNKIIEIVGKEAEKEIISKYFRKELTMIEVEEIASKVFGCTVNITEISDVGASLDIDFKHDDKKMIKWHSLFRNN